MTLGNCMSEGQTFDAFSHLTLSPVANTIGSEDADQIEPCETGSQEGWTIYGVNKDGESAALHDTYDVTEAVVWLCWISKANTLPVMYFCERYGLIGCCTYHVTPSMLCDQITTEIHDQIPGYDNAEDFQNDDFDNHPLADVREVLAELSGYAG